VTIATNMAGRGTDILLGGNPEFMARLKMREMLMPKVVNLVDEEDGPRRLRPLTINSWNVSPKLYPCSVSDEGAKLANEAVDAAVASWGAGQLAELDAEERLAFACEKAPTDDPVVQKIRAAFLRIEADFKKVTDEEKVEVQELGGLHVVGTERHESRRIDNQVRLNCRCTNAVVLLFFSFAQCTCYPMMND
jgi:preprotein translocase subunit SecA